MPGRFSRRCRRPSRPPSRVCKQGAGVRVPLAPGDDHSQPPLRMATPTLSTIRQARSVSNQLSNYGGVQTGTHPASRGPGRRSIRTQARPPGLLRDEEVAGSNPVTPTTLTRGDALAEPRCRWRGRRPRSCSWSCTWPGSRSGGRRRDAGDAGLGCRLDRRSRCHLPSSATESFRQASAGPDQWKTIASGLSSQSGSTTCR
jgi:hypothetical protein